MYARPFIFALLFASTLQIGIRPAVAQYMFLDLDGDGVWTYHDFPDGTSATIDVYLVTDQDAFGYPATCSDGSDLDLKSYTVNLYALDAAVRFTSVTNQIPEMSEVVPLATYPYALTVGYGGAKSFPPGKYHLLRITAEFESGCPAVSIVRSSCYSPPGVVTSFGSSCAGVGSDNQLSLGEDWWDAWGFGCSDLLGRWPSLSCPATVSGVEGQELTFPVTLTTPDCGIDAFNVHGLPPGASFSGLSPFVAGEASGVVTWTPGYGQAGSYAIMFRASQYPNPFHNVQLQDTCTTLITIAASNARPIAKAGGPYTGVQDVPVSFNGANSVDPNGDGLQFAWTFGDGGVGSGSTPNHVYAIGGIFSVLLTVTDPGGLAGRDSTTASIIRDLPVRVFTWASNRTTLLPSGKPMTCFQVEPLPGESLLPEEVLAQSVTLRYDDPVCGLAEARVAPTKSTRITDTDRNGIPEYEACFSQDGMTILASCLPRGSSVVRLELQGSLANGDRFHGEIFHTIISKSGSLLAAVSPNPLSQSSTLGFATTTQGFATARVFDVRGRLVVTLLDERSLPAGSHYVPLNGLDRARGRLPSGIYFLKVTTEHDGSETRTLAVLR